MSENSNNTFLDLEVLDFDVSGNDTYLCLGAVNKTHGSALSDLVDTFIDDTRIRGASDNGGGNAAEQNIYRTMSMTDRQTETNALQTKGGWRDHTDGNRITTTRGDKVEVIRGNYKMLVLGRKQWNNADAGVGLNYESSGGITYHFDEVPGQYVDIRWDYDVNAKKWVCIEETDKGQTTDRFHGTAKEWMQGGDVVTRVGSLEGYHAKHGSGTLSASDSDHFKSDPHFDIPNNPSHVLSWPTDNALGDVYEEVYADNVTSKAYAGSFESHLGSSSRKVNQIYTQSNSTQLLEENNYDDYDLVMKGGFAFEFWLGGSYFEFFNGVNVSMKHSFFIDFRGGLVINEINLGGIAEIGVGVLATINVTTALVKILDIVIAPMTVEWCLGFRDGWQLNNSHDMDLGDWVVAGMFSES